MTVLQEFQAQRLLYILGDANVLRKTQAFELHSGNPSFASLLQPTIIRGEVDDPQHVSALDGRLCQDP